MTTLAWMLWTAFTVAAAAGCWLSAGVGDPVFAGGIGVCLGLLAFAIHYVLT